MLAPTKRITLLYFALAAIILLLNNESIKQLYEHRYFIYEQDAYMHLAIAQDFLNNPDLYAHFNPRINTPWGGDTHGWTNFVTLILAGGALIFNLVFPLKSALYLWAFFLPLLVNLIALWAMLWAIKPFQPSVYQQAFIALAFLFNPFLHDYFLPLRVDYDFLLITLSIFYWGFLLRLIQRESIRNSITTGLIACFGLWTSISFMLPLLLGLIFLLGQNFNQKTTKTTLYSFLLTLIAGLIPIIFAEQQSVFTITHDVISIVHVTFFSTILASFTLYHRLKPSSLPAQISLIIVFMLLAFGLMNYLFPGFYLGPYNQATPFVRAHLFPNVSEFHSPFAISNTLVLALFFYSLLGCGYFYYLRLSEPLSSSEKLLFYATLLFTIMTAYMYRWSVFYVPLTIWLSSFWVQQFIASRMLVRISMFLGTILFPSLILSLSPGYTNPEQERCEEQLYSMLHNNFFTQAQFGQDKRLFVHSNYGPLFLYATDLSIVATNDHHNPQGVQDSYYFFKGNEQTAKQIADKRQIDLILICPGGYSLGFNPRQANWLKSIPLPDNYSKWQLYRRITSAK